MAGVKGKSGGARPNSGGKRPGAGRKPKVVAEKSANTAAPKKPGKAAPAVEATLEPQAHGGALKRTAVVPAELPEMDMLAMLQAVALGRVPATNIQVRAAIAAVQYTHTKRGDGGKKEDVAARSGLAAKGKFGVRAGPLKLVGSGN